ncbi:MAG TPA: alpha/beta hydrolase [Porphyromonadaceae bacterium]|nr:alpha/beta hydrolase [Porphyromonadaceae bacterium]
MKQFYLFVIFLAVQVAAFGQQPKEILLYDKIEETIPEEHIHDQGGNLIVSKVTNPSLTAYIPSGKAKAAVIICPGGAYENLHIQREGFRVAEAFNKEGVAAFVLKYRLPDEQIVQDAAFAPLKDAQRAIQLVRERATEWGVDPDKVGIMGFSAGGHLASSLGVHYDTLLVDNDREINLRPDFMILIYPVISFSDEITHGGSKHNLLGDHPSEESVKFFTNDLQVNTESPKTVLIHAGDDGLVPVDNSVYFYEALRKHHVPAELHIYSRGNHGFGETPAFGEWFGRCIHWLKTEKEIMN